MRHDIPKLHGTGVRIGDRTLAVPGYPLLKELGRGANAVVFQADDQALHRKVAVKIWNSRGVKRAQFESAKIAGMNHPCIVTTYQFGWVEEHPFCVMELVPGVSGKKWMEQGRSIQDRLSVWKRYCTALRYIHSSGSVHGDPHLGNILVSAEDVMHEDPLGNAHSDVKVADAGTSEFWASHRAIEKREADLILETAGRLFQQENFNVLWRHPAGLDYRETLTALQSVSKYLQIAFGTADWDYRSLVADMLADLILETPFFEIDVVLSHVKQTGVTDRGRLARRLNARLQKLPNVMDASDEICEETKLLYDRAAKAAALSIGQVTALRL